MTFCSAGVTGKNPAAIFGPKDKRSMMPHGEKI